MRQSTPDASNRHYTIAAFAIEDRVDFRFLDFAPSSGADLLFIERERARDDDGVIWPRGSRGSRRDHDRDFLFKDKLTWRKGRSYFEALLPVLRRALTELHKAYVEDGASPLWDIQAFVVSMPGVIEDGVRVVQLPLWNWPAERRVMWQGPDPGIPPGPFDFSEEIRAIIDTIAPRPDHDHKIPHVINDTVACATAAYFHAGRETRGDLHNTTYLRAHNGINLTFIGEGKLDRRHDHAESGHLRILLHDDDDEIKFTGVCPFHGACVEGMLAPRAWTERANPRKRGAGRIEAWHELFFAHNQPEFAPPERRDVRIMKHLTRRILDPKAIDIAGFYLAQLVCTAFLMPPAPERVFIGGRLATDPILEKVRHYVDRLLRGYPARKSFENLNDAIQPANTQGRRFVELSGALLYAYALSSDPHPSTLLDLAKAAAATD